MTISDQHSGPSPPQRSLLDHNDDFNQEVDDDILTNPFVSPERSSFRPFRSDTIANRDYLEFEPADGDLLGIDTGGPIQTSSGLLLTHRRTIVSPRNNVATPVHSNLSHQRRSVFEVSPPLQGHHYSRFGNKPRQQNMTLNKARRLLSYAKVWIALFFLVLLLGTIIVLKHSYHERRARPSTVSSAAASSIEQQATVMVEPAAKDRIILIPFPNTTQQLQLQLQQQNQQQQQQQQSQQEVETPGRRLFEHPKKSKHSKHSKHSNSKHAKGGLADLVKDLRHEFEEWAQKHDKKYHSHTEKEKRFHVWRENHHRTLAKNERHGPCKMTKQPVFGSNMFKDLTQEEFKAQFLTGYKGPKADELTHHANHPKIRPISPGNGMVLDPSQRKGPLHAVERHPKVQEKLEQHLKEIRKSNSNETPKPSVKKNGENKKVIGGGKRKLYDHGDRALGYAGGYTSSGYKYSSSCSWYDVSCWLRWFVNEYGYGVGGTMEPEYDSDTYPEAIDWRDMGVVTDVKSQGNCGACWAITAVETVESAYAINSGTLRGLSDVEIITCDDSCEMCNGGWPQNAYEYIMEHDGIPSSDSIYYDGDFLLAMTMAMEGQSDELSEYEIQSYMQQVCPAGGGDHSGDGGGNGYSRYGGISGYGYTTDRCICYTDGTGCDCDDQNEKIALMNLASYGPATVCLEASLWQDYEGGIMTSDIGCSRAFLDMNHCVQAVGYAFTDGNDDGDDDDSKSGSGSGSGSGDDANREGYWIIRNQWSENWGMNGYAYLAMGDNTCGVLNDMTNVYM